MPFYDSFPSELRRLFQAAALNEDSLEELRLRIGQPLALRYKSREYGITGAGILTEDLTKSVRIGSAQLEAVLEALSGCSLYAFSEETRQGFFTIPGGHRVGIAGKAVLENGKVRCIRNISFLNLRFSHEKKGCASGILPYLFEHGQLCDTLLIGPPRCGKTTLLRDLIRQLSTGSAFHPGMTVGVVDERSEIGGAYLGIPQNDLGPRTDLLDGCRKSEGMLMLLRAMAPYVIAADDLGSQEDRYAIESVFHCGCHLIATAHGVSPDGNDSSPLLRALLEQRLFQRLVLLSGRPYPGTVIRISDADGRFLNADDKTTAFMKYHKECSFAESRKPASKKLSLF